MCPECGRALRVGRIGRTVGVALGLALASAAIFLGGRLLRERGRENSETSAKKEVPDRSTQSPVASGTEAGQPTIFALDRLDGGVGPADEGVPRAGPSPQAEPGGSAPRVGPEDSTSPGPPEAVRKAASSILMLQTFDAAGRPWREGAAGFIDGATVVVWARSVLGAVSGRGWEVGGGFFRVASALAFDRTSGLAALRLEGANPPPSLGIRLADPAPDEPFFAVTPTAAGTPGVTVGVLSREDSETGEERWRFDGRAPAGEAWILDREGRVTALLSLPDAAGTRALVGAAAIDRLLLASYPRTLEALNAAEYEGTPEAHLDRALARLADREYGAAVHEFLALARIAPSRLRDHETSLAAALLGAIDEGRAGARYGELADAVEEILERVGSLRAVHVQAARLFVEARRYESAVRALLGAIDSSPESAAELAPLLLDAYYLWGDARLREGRAREAAAVFEQGIAHVADPASLYVGLGRARAAFRDYDGARMALEEALLRDGRLADVIEPELEEIYRHLGGEGVLTVDIPTDARLIPVDVLVSAGRSRAIETMYIDSGASWSFLTREFADRLGIVVTPRTHHAVFATANGEVTLPVVVLDEVNFRGFVVRDVEAAIGDLSEGSFRGGVLGNNFLRHFTITIDRPRGKMTFEAAR